MTRLTTATVAFTTTPGVTRIECSRDGAAFAACTSPVKLTGVAAGSRSLQIRAFDAQSQGSGVQTATWLVDRLAPTIASPRPTATQRVRRGTRPVISAVVRDRGGATARVARLQLKVDGKLVPTRLVRSTARGVVTYRMPRPTSRGRHTVQLLAIDAAGNRTAKTWRFTAR